MKQWLQRICFTELYFSSFARRSGTQSKRGKFQKYRFLKGLIPAILYFTIWSFIQVDNLTFHTTAISSLMVAFFAFGLFGHSQEKMAYLHTLPLSTRDFLLGRLFWALFLGLISAVAYVWEFYLMRDDLWFYFGSEEIWTFSQFLVFGLVHFSAVLLSFSLAALLCICLSKAAFLWIYIPLSLVVLNIVALDKGANLIRHFWIEDITIYSGLLIFLAVMALTALCYWGMACRMNRWQARKKATIKRPWLHLVAALAVLIICSLVWERPQYRSPVDENLTPEEQYQVAVECLEEGDIYGAAVSFYACGDYGDARERCWEMWGRIVPRSTIAVNEYQVAALTADGGILVTSVDICDSETLSKFTGPEIAPADISNPQELISIHGENQFMVGLYADGTVGLWGDLPGEEDEEIARWTDIVALFPGYHEVLGLRADGTALYCGDGFGQNEAALQRWTDLVAVSPAVDYIGLRPDGTVIATGNSRDGRNSVELWRNVVAVDTGNYHTAGLRADGTVSANGINWAGQCDTRQWTDIVAIDAGLYSTVGLRSDGTVVMAGLLVSGFVPPVGDEVATWREVVAISVSNQYVVGLRSDGTLLAIGIDRPIQEAVSDWGNIRIPN